MEEGLEDDDDYMGIDYLQKRDWKKLKFRRKRKKRKDETGDIYDQYGLGFDNIIEAQQAVD